MKKIFLCVVISFAAVRGAEATGTFYVDSASGDDTNNCTSEDTPCLTIDGVKTLITALPDPSNTTIKLSGTFTDAISFSVFELTEPDTFDGLRLTATDADNQPSIDTSVAATTAVSMTGINDVTIDHLTISGGTEGISVNGSGANLASNINIHHNDISGIAPTVTGSAIELTSVKNSVIHDNTIHDLSASGMTTTSLYLYGIYISAAQDIAVRKNTITDLTATTTVDAASSQTLYIYGMYLYNIHGSIVKKNTVDSITITDTATVTGTYQYDYVWGVYAVYLFNTTISNNSFSNITSTLSADVDSNYGLTNAVGIFVSDIRPDDGVALINNNTIDTVTATQSSDSGAPTAQGMSVQYGYNATITDNTINQISTSHTSSIATTTTYGSATGISAPYFGANTTVSQNSIDHVYATTSYTGADSGSNVTVRGIYQYAGGGTISQNTISNLFWSISNNGIDSYYDYATLYGIDSGYSNGTILTGNRLRHLSASYTATGAAGTAISYTYPISVTGSDSAIVQNNRVNDVDVTATVTDPTDASYLYLYVYGLFANKAPNLTVHHNRLSQFTVAGDAGNSNTMFNYSYPYYFNYVSGTISRNRLANYTLTSDTDSDGINHLFYGVTLTTASALTSITDTIIRDVTSTSTGPDTGHTDMGMVVFQAGPGIMIEGNQLRPIVATTTGTMTSYGIYLGADATHARLLDNIILGDAASAATVHNGIYLTSDSSTDVDLIHNTIADWMYPIQADGGNKIYLRNNILSAVGADSYALAIARDTMNNDTFKSDYNLLYNATVSDQLVYDTDNTLGIALGDWTNVGGSYGYDVHSINKPPKINATGRIQKGSKAMNAGSKDYPYEKTDTEMTYLTTDINGDTRPVFAKKKQVDIGADEFKK